MRRLTGTALLSAALLATGLYPAPAGAADIEHTWDALKSGGHVVLVRHAQTEPGIGDPPGFRLADCGTQRNLSQQGRADAQRIGTAFKSRGIPVAAVRSSRWCRCLETARLAFGTAEPDPSLDSMFREDEAAGKKKLLALQAAFRQPPASGNLVMVTHSQNILALTGVSLGSGDMLVVRPAGTGGMQVVGMLPLAEAR